MILVYPKHRREDFLDLSSETKPRSRHEFRWNTQSNALRQEDRRLPRKT